MTRWIVGLDNPSSRDPTRALEPDVPTSAGGRLFVMSGLSMDDYLDAFRRVNVVDRPHDFRRGDYVVVLGRIAWRRLRLPPGVTWWQSYPREGITFALVPHPSGLSRAYNKEANRTALRGLLQRLARTNVQGG